MPPETENSAPIIAGLLLAAGESRRMGERNKLLLPIEGRPLVRRSLETLLASRLAEIVVVLGHEAEAVREALTGLPARQVENPDYRDGQQTSVHRGMEGLTQPCDAVMVCLADQPKLTPADIDALIDGFVAREGGSILVPMHDGRRGNPVIFDARHRAEVLAGKRNLGCRRLIERNPGLVTTLAVDNDHYVVDIDTPAEYGRLSGSGETPASAIPA